MKRALEATAYWFVIEGDNGAGKDSLAERLVGDGWHLASNTPPVLEAMERARQLDGDARVAAYWAYNRVCGTTASSHPSPSMLVRYWPSTLAAGYADGVLEWDDFTDRCKEASDSLPIPELTVYLQCRLDVRRHRVRGRGPVEGAVDDVSNRRNHCYREAVAWLASQSLPSRWCIVDTSDLDPEQVWHRVRSEIANAGARP